MAPAPTDIVILGGGIAGLWMLGRLRQAGYRALLLTDGDLGAGQSVASQGIIHSGLKYNIPGFEDQALPALQAMPGRWRGCFLGGGEIDLSGARILADEFHMHVRSALASGIKAGLARHSMRSATRDVATADWPSPLRAAGGTLFAVDEFVVDVPSVLATVQARHGDAIRRLPAGASPPRYENSILHVAGCEIVTRQLVLAAGAGNETLSAALGVADAPAQRRPLRQVMIDGMPVPIYAHVVGGGVKPLATVTAHPSQNGGWVWYVGGDIAEKGAGLDEPAALAAARRELPELFPGADFSNARWATLAVDRAEYGGAGGRPGDAVLLGRDGILVAWPTKLALAPRLADLVLERLRQGVSPGGGDVPAAFAALPVPAIAPTPWQETTKWI
jgi:glycine/D-amino acid oxidase-like deaminating enzyme